VTLAINDTAPVLRYRSDHSLRAGASRMAIASRRDLSTSNKFVRKYDPSSIIFKEGELGSEFFIVLSGCVSIQKAIDCEIRELAVFRAGEFFGEMAVIDRRPRSAAAIAGKSGAEVMAIDTAHFIHLVSQQPGFAMLIMDTLTRRQRGGLLDSTLEIVQKRDQPHYEIHRIDETCIQLRSKFRSCNAYVFTDKRKTSLVDTGLPSWRPALCSALQEIGVATTDVDVVVLTHEHFDHTGAVSLFSNTAIVAAHPLAANKIRLRDKFATMQYAFGEPFSPTSVDWELQEGVIIEAARRQLRVLHTPGHTSGGISLIDQSSGLLLSGDTVMKGGPIGGIFGSGNISDMIYSLNKLKSLSPYLLLPGHGPLSTEAGEDIRLTVARCHTLLTNSQEMFDVLGENDSVNVVMSCYRDLNRSFMKEAANEKSPESFA
jgi:hydroxyacylglutathione hydrolase